MLPAHAAPLGASGRGCSALSTNASLWGSALEPSPAAAEPIGGRRWEPGEGGCAGQCVNSFISPAARGERPLLSLPVCASEGEGARGRSRCRSPEHRQPPALCAGLRRLALFAGRDVSARSGEQGLGMVQTNYYPPRKGGDGDGDGDCDCAGHQQPAGAATWVSLGRAPRGAPDCSGISFRGEG